MLTECESSPPKQCFIICCFLSHCNGFRELNRTFLLPPKRRPLSLTPRAELLLHALLTNFTVWIFFLLNVLTTNNFSYNFIAYITEVHCKSQNTPAFLLRKRGLVPNKEVTTKAMEAQEIRASNNCYREMVEVLRRKSLIFTFTILFSTHFRILNCHNVQLQYTK